MVQNDTILHYGRSLVQHGHYNNRVYLMRIAPGECEKIIRFADGLVQKEGYTKIIAKVRESRERLFKEAGYITEAAVPDFFGSHEKALFMAKYRDPARMVVGDEREIADVMRDVSGYTDDRSSHELPGGFTLSYAGPDDAHDIAALYRRVFETYPFPIFDPDYIRTTMQEHVRYFVIKKAHLLAAVASCEIDYENRNVEVTDFATNPLFRGRGFAGILLRSMEGDMQKDGIRLAYTIARALFRPINAVFAGAGYQFGGLLKNNTNISGSLESMNVWYRKL